MKKYFLFSCFLGFFSFCYLDIVFGEVVYENSGVVFFYGMYEYFIEELIIVISNFFIMIEFIKLVDGGVLFVFFFGVYGLW